MAYYFIVNISISNPEEYQKYIDGAGTIFKQYNGKYIALDDTPAILEGHWDYTRLVLIEFPTKEDFNAWYYSEEYQNILKHRLSGAACDSILAKGLNNH